MASLLNPLKKEKKDMDQRTPQPKKTLVIDAIQGGSPSRALERKEADVSRQESVGEQELMEGERAADETSEVKKEEKGEVSPSETEAPSLAAPAPASPIVKDPIMQEIESILEEDLGDLYANMPEYLQHEFRKKGESAAGAIRQILESGKVQVKKILQIILDWLKMIPGINKFFLEQEAKIKTDKILLLEKTRKKK